MKKNDLVAAIAAKENCPKKEADKALNLVLDAITDALVAGEKVAITGFGTFEVRDRKEKQVKNPQTGKMMTAPASKAPAFKARNRFLTLTAPKASFIPQRLQTTAQSICC